MATELARTRISGFPWDLLGISQVDNAPLANGAPVLVNLSNDAWYGDSGAYAQHLKQARMRAIENNRWLLHDANTGVTASIDNLRRMARQRDYSESFRRCAWGSC